MVTFAAVSRLESSRNPCSLSRMGRSADSPSAGAASSTSLGLYRSVRPWSPTTSARTMSKSCTLREKGPFALSMAATWPTTR
jgi:hypothetical protein